MSGRRNLQSAMFGMAAAAGLAPAWPDATHIVIPVDQVRDVADDRVAGVLGRAAHHAEVCAAPTAGSFRLGVAHVSHSQRNKARGNEIKQAGWYLLARRTKVYKVAAGGCKQIACTINRLLGRCKPLCRLIQWLHGQVTPCGEDRPASPGWGSA